MLRLNSIPNKVFDAFETEDVKLKVNSSNGGVKTYSRQDIVATGRLVACEFAGSVINKRPNQIEKYNSRLNGGNIDYTTLSRKHTEKKLLFCAAQVAKLTGGNAPETFEEFKKNAQHYATDELFLRVMAEIDRDVLDPLFFSVIDSVGMDLMQWEPVQFGATKQITVRSNDVFLWEDSSWGSGKSTSKNYLYAKTITLTPKVYSCNASIKWYHDIVAGDAGRYYAAIMLGMYNKIYAMNVQALKTAIADGKYIPAGLTAETYTSTNWLTITDKVAAANGVRVEDLMAVGTRSALSNLLPVDGNGGALVGLQYGLGEQWFTNGYLPKAQGIDLFPVTPVIVPGTQNNELLTIDTGNDIFVFAKGLYRPMYGAYMEGTPITLTATPGGTGNAQGTADFTIDINAGAMFDIKPVFATKVGVITSVYPTPAVGA